VDTGRWNGGVAQTTGKPSVYRHAFPKCSGEPCPCLWSPQWLKRRRIDDIPDYRGHSQWSGEEVATDFLITLFTLFFLFRDSPSLLKTVHKALPIDPKAKTEILATLDQTVVAVVRGTLLTAVAQGFVAGMMYWLLGIPFPLLLGALSGLLSLLPVGGTAFIWGPAAVYLFVSGAVGKALVLVAVGAGIVGLMDNVLHPFLVGTGVDLPLIVLFFASVGGLAYFGFIGLFLGPIVIGLAKATFHIFQQNYQRASA
jgi:predicted PurR-regulated permease PerM